MRRLGGWAIAVFAVLAVAGCGSSKSSSATSSTSASSSTGANAAIAAQVPAKYKSKGTLEIGMEAQYAPNEFLAPDGHTIIGMDADMIAAIAHVMGLKVNLINANFEAIIPGIQAGRYDLGVSSFTDTKEREKVVDFVTYYSAGISFYAKTASSPGVKTLADLCGKKVAVQKGTVEEEEANAEGKKCAKEGKKSVTVLSFTNQNPVNLAVASGRGELGMADSPVVAYQIKQSAGAFKLIGESYNFKPYGFAIPKNSGLAAPMLAALKLLMSNGSYTQILTKWGIQSGAISNPKINGAIS
jgi:polar amino acid transport system substrate-binding protein